MSVARHPRPPELADTSLEEIMDTYVARFSDRVPDWEAFEDAKIEGYKRASIGLSGPADRASMATPTPSLRAHTR